MRGLAPMLLPLSLLACAQEQPQQAAAPNSQHASAEAMEISRTATRQAIRGPENWFTGTATITPLFDPKGLSQVGAALVRFVSGARTAWHVHPLGQRLIVTEGSGWTQIEGGATEAIRAGDVVWCPPGVRHWHGATLTTAMTHIAVQESQNGSPVAWMEQVTDEQYRGGGA